MNDIIDRIVQVDRVRVRPAGKTIFIEVQASVARTMPVQRVQLASREVSHRVHQAFPDADAAQPRTSLTSTTSGSVDR